MAAFRENKFVMSVVTGTIEQKKKELGCDDGFDATAIVGSDFTFAMQVGVDSDAFIDLLACIDLKP